MAALPINSRKGFFDVLRQTLAEAKKRSAETPDFEPLAEIARQLEAMKRWTDGGREPTEEERGKISIGLIAIRELDPEPNEELYDFIQRLHELNGYFREWPTQGGKGANADA